MKQKEQNKVIDASQLLMDQDAERILLGTYKKSRSAVELSEIYGIPIVACFRKIRQLKDMGLLKVERIDYSFRNRKTEYYSASLDNAYVFYDSGRLKVRFKVVLQMANDFRRRYEGFSEVSSPADGADYQNR